MRTGRYLPVGLLIAFACLLPVAAAGQPQLENVLDLSGAALFVGGIAYDTTSDHLFVADSNGEQVLEVDRTTGAPIQSWAVPVAGISPVGITYHPPSGHLFLVGEFTNMLYEVARDGTLIASFTFSAPPASVSGCTFNESTGTLFVVDDGADTMFESALDGTVLAVRSLLIFGIFDADAIAHNPLDGTLLIGDDTGRRLFEIDVTATILVNLYDLGPAGLNTGGVEGLAVDPLTERVFIANGLTRQIYEFSGLIGGTVPVAPATWGDIKASFGRRPAR